MNLEALDRLDERMRGEALRAVEPRRIAVGLELARAEREDQERPEREEAPDRLPRGVERLAHRMPVVTHR